MEKQGITISCSSEDLDRRSPFGGNIMNGTVVENCMEEGIDKERLRTLSRMECQRNTRNSFQPIFLDWYRAQNSFLARTYGKYVIALKENIDAPRPRCRL